MYFYEKKRKKSGIEFKKMYFRRFENVRIFAIKKARFFQIFSLKSLVSILF